MRQFVKFNINNTIKLRLTELGYEVWKAHDDEFLPEDLRRPLSYYKEQADADQFVTLQLWTVMKIFGEHVGMARPDVFVDCNALIEINEPA